MLVINNRPVGSRADRVSRIVEIAEKFPATPTVEVVHFRDLGDDLPSDTRAVILSGSSYNSSEFEREGTRTHSETRGGKDFHSEMGTIRKASAPILATCFGHTLVAKAFGGEVRRNVHSSEWNRAIRISVDRGDEFLAGEYVVDVNHRDYVPPNDERIAEHFHIQSVSTDKEDARFRYIQYMRHKRLPIFSVQFHPETHERMPDGYTEHEDETFAEAKREGERIIHRFLELCLPAQTSGADR